MDTNPNLSVDRQMNHSPSVVSPEQTMMQIQGQRLVRPQTSRPPVQQHVWNHLSAPSLNERTLLQYGSFELFPAHGLNYI